MNNGERSTVPLGVWIGLAAVAGLTLVAEFYVHHHASFGVDGEFAFYAWFTVICGVAGVAIARILAAVLRRRGDYRD